MDILGPFRRPMRDLLCSKRAGHAIRKHCRLPRLLGQIARKDLRMQAVGWQMTPLYQPELVCVAGYTATLVCNSLYLNNAFRFLMHLPHDNFSFDKSMSLKESRLQEVLSSLALQQVREFDARMLFDHALTDAERVEMDAQIERLKLPDAIDELDAKIRFFLLRRHCDSVLNKLCKYGLSGHVFIWRSIVAKIVSGVDHSVGQACLDAIEEHILHGHYGPLRNARLSWDPRENAE